MLSDAFASMGAISPDLSLECEQGHEKECEPDNELKGDLESRSASFHFEVLNLKVLSDSS